MFHAAAHRLHEVEIVPVLGVEGGCVHDPLFAYAQHLQNIKSLTLMRPLGTTLEFSNLIYFSR